MTALARFVLLISTVATLAASADDSLVEASKAAKANRKKSTTKVITNADVKKSKGVLIDSNAPQAPLPPAGATSDEIREARRKARERTESQIVALDKEIASIDAEMAAIEQSYYDENDLRRRDTDIVQRFGYAKAKRDAVVAQRDVLRDSMPPAENDASPDSRKSGQPVGKPPAKP